jgi:hypothetical protein
MLTKFVKGLTVVAGLLVFALGLVAGLSGVAHASSFNCVSGAGCGTFHSVDNQVTPHPIAFDAKNQSPTGIVIGYPDLLKDRATSFDKVEHERFGVIFYTLVYAPDGNWSNQCVTLDGSDQLALKPCTLGHDSHQQFLFRKYTAPGSSLGDVYSVGSPQEVSNLDYHTQYVIESVNSGRYVADTATVSATVPQPTATDSRQLTALTVVDTTPASIPTASPLALPSNVLWTFGR